jgi:hypothetical protein
MSKWLRFLSTTEYDGKVIWEQDKEYEVIYEDDKIYQLNNGSIEKSIKGKLYKVLIIE